jgi:hypothetical protein
VGILDLGALAEQGIGFVEEEDAVASLGGVEGEVLGLLGIGGGVHPLGG